MDPLHEQPLPGRSAADPLGASFPTPVIAERDAGVGLPIPHRIPTRPGIPPWHGFQVEDPDDDHQDGVP